MSGFNVNCGDCIHCGHVLDGDYYVCCHPKIIKINRGWPHVDLEKNIDCNFFEDDYKSAFDEKTSS